MFDAAVLVLGLSLVLQLGAAAMALRLVRLTGWKATWVLIATAIALMAIRRAITLYGISADVRAAPDLNAELVALAISVLMVLGIGTLGPVITAVRRAEEEVRQLIGAAPEAILITGEDDRIVLANAQAGRLFGHFPHQLVGRPVADLMPERYRDRHTAARKAYLAAPHSAVVPREGDVHGLHAKGHEFPVQISVTTLETRDGLRLVASVRDMSRIREAQSALRKSETRYRSLLNDVLDNTSVAVSILDADLRIAWVNRAYESYLGLERDDIIGMPARQIARQKLAAALANGEQVVEKLIATYDDNSYTEHFECQVLPDDRRLERWLDFWSQPIDSGLYRGGRLEQFAEITQRRNAEQRIRQFVHIARNMRIGLLVYHLEDVTDDRTLRVRILNPEGERLLGVTEADVAGKCIDEAFPGLRADGIPQLFASVIREGDARDVRDFDYGDDRVERGGWKFRAFGLPEQCIGVLFERIGPSSQDAEQ